MIICRAPFRVSFTGGGSDIADFFKRTPGAVISTSIDSYMYLSLHPFFELDKIHLKYSMSELVSKYDQIKHPIFRTVLEETSITGVEISSMADIPSGSGLGSSSAFTVALWHCFSAYQNVQLFPVIQKYVGIRVVVSESSFPVCAHRQKSTTRQPTS